MSSENAKINIVITVVIINHIKYITNAQSFGTRPLLFNPSLFNRRTLLHPSSVYTWPRPVSAHCCSNSRADVVQKHGVITLGHFESSTYSNDQMMSPFGDPRNLGQYGPRTITSTLHRAPLAASPWFTNQKTLDYIYWSGIKNRLRLRKYSTENLMKNNQNENNSKHSQYLYISTTEKLIRSERTEKYSVSVDPTDIFDDPESQSEDNLRDGIDITEPSTTVHSANTKQSVMEYEHIVKNIDISDSFNPVSASVEETENVKYPLEKELGPNDKDLDPHKGRATPADCDKKNMTNPAVTVDKVFFIDELNDTWKQNNDKDILDKFLHALDELERTFYMSTFTKLSANSPAEKAENGISFVQSGLLLHLMLTALTTTVDPTTRAEIEACSNFPATEKDKIHALRLATAWLPKSNNVLRFRWSSRLLLGPTVNVSEGFRNGTAAQARMLVDTLNTTSDPQLLMNTLNHMIEADSGGAMRDTFDEDDLSAGVHNVLVSTMYVRGSWRAAPTLLAQPRPFRDADSAPQPTRMIRVNDVVNYADLAAWDAEAVELSYATPGLSLLVLVPRGRSLRALAVHVARAGVRSLPAALAPRRLAVSMPLYTLRMTLLLPNKLQDMGITGLVTPPDSDGTNDDSLKVSHAVQRLMFWSEAGRNAFKDDGIEWDQVPEMEIILDRPYLFFVRWLNVTLMNGHFVL